MLIIGDQKQNKKPASFEIGEAIETEPEKDEETSSKKAKRRVKSLIKRIKYPFS